MSSLDKLESFFAYEEDGISNLEKVRKNQRVIRRLPSTDLYRSYEDSDYDDSGNGLPGVVIEDGKLIGFGIHIFNEDIYPLKYFEIYLRNCGLSGELDISGCRDMLFLDVYHNSITAIQSVDLPSMRIFGVQDNRLEKIDCSGMPGCYGIDAGKNRLKEIDVSKNQELVELYINDNQITEIDLSCNPKLKYFYCHNNGISRLDTRKNPLLRHLNATGNPMKEILCFAPQQEDRLPLELRADEGGCVGLRFNPIYNAQWKETGEWQQSYYAYADEGYVFTGWYTPDGELVSPDAAWDDEYGTSRCITAIFALKDTLIRETQMARILERAHETGI